MKRLVAHVAFSLLIMEASALAAEKDAHHEARHQERPPERQDHKQTQEPDPGALTPITFYCCDAGGVVRCSVNAPGPVGSSCFCPGIVPAGTLCLPK